MSEKWCINGITDASLSKKYFYEELISTIWIVVDHDGTPPQSGTGFCIDQRGYILTCNHVCESDIVYCFNVGPDDLYSRAKVVRRLPSWDMALLQLDDHQTIKYDYVKMCDGLDQVDQVFCGQDVYAIGNPNELNRSFMIGKVVYPCEEYNLDSLDMDFKATNSNYNHRASVYDSVQLHRTIGNTSSKDDSPDLNPNVPIIQIGRFCSDSGACGSPVFNERGCVVGMHFASCGHQALAIHFYALNRFINIVGRDLDDEAAMTATEEEKKPKKKKKRKKEEKKPKKE